MPVKNPVTLKELAAYPQMARWFNPILLLKLLRNVIVSTMFGQYADRRLIVAALDTVPKEELLDRATVHTRLPEGKPVLAPDEEGAVWIDFVADLGDGFDATFAVASLLAKETIEVNDHVTRRGQILVMGGDEVYPLASGKAYQEQLRDPYGWASPPPTPIRPFPKASLSTAFQATTIGTMVSLFSWHCFPAKSHFIWAHGARRSGGATLP